MERRKNLGPRAAFFLFALQGSPRLTARTPRMSQSSAPPAAEHIPELVLEAGRADAHYWRDLWRYRELFVFLTWRDLLVRYKQTAVGVAWAVLQPAMTTAVFCVFGYLLKLPTG